MPCNWAHLVIPGGHSAALVVLLVAALPAQEGPGGASQPAFHVQTDVVVMPFEVRRGSRPVSDVKASDVVLLEDGRPRDFTTFEPPSETPSLELVVMFDVTDVEHGGFWSASALREFASFWNEATAQALVNGRGPTIRVALYQFNRSRLRQLSPSTSDSKVLLESLRRLTEPIPANQAQAFTLPSGTLFRTEQSSEVDLGSFSLAAAITTLHHSGMTSARGARALVVVSHGAESTSLTPQDLADEARAADVRLYPVVLPTHQRIAYDGPFMGQLGICLDFDGTLPHPGRALQDCPVNPLLAHVAQATGGRSFEALRVPVTDITSAPSRFSMTGAHMNAILNAVKAHALARISSTYRVSFSPASSTAPRPHTLEVKLAVKDKGKVNGGKRMVTY